MMEFILKDLKRDWKLGPDLDGLMAGIVFLGMFCGAFAWGLFSDRYGRATTYLVTSLFIGIFGMLTALSHQVWTFLVCRFFVGFGFGGSHAAFTLWQEFVPEKYRGRMLLLNQLFWTLGALLEALLAWWILPRWGWRNLMIASAVLPFITASFYIMLPESPRYLVVQNRPHEAAQVLRDVARANGATYPEEDRLIVRYSVQMTKTRTARRLSMPNTSAMAAEQESQQVTVESQSDNHAGDIRELFDWYLLRTTIMLVAIWCADTFVYYGSAFITPEFFKGSSLYTAAVITACAEVPGIFLPMLTLDTIGRKWTLLILLGIASMFMFIVAYIKDSTGILICLCIGRMCASSSFTVTFIYTSEIYPTSIRSTALGTLSALSRLAGFATTYVAMNSDRLLSSTLYAVVALAAAVASLLLKYDTKGRRMCDTVEEFRHRADEEKNQKERDEAPPLLRPGAVEEELPPPPPPAETAPVSRVIDDSDEDSKDK